MKRKAEAAGNGGGWYGKKVKKVEKALLSDNEVKSRFRKNLFDSSILNRYTSEYASSSPYKHAVISDLINDTLLRSVRAEIQTNISFTPKETDIYKIHQSGDLANLDGLEDEALAKLPSLLALRDALYSSIFRQYISHITGCGPLSGRKTDMAINVYTPGCYLLCHDDAIGSRKVSYILYLTDPDMPWQAHWGGALRLFPVSKQKGADGEIAHTPQPDPVKVIPPAWNQLSFFAVQPGESFHDVEEVYHASSASELKACSGRIRMAISGWFHIPQAGEDGYIKGAEEKAAQKGGLMQLQGNPDQHDRPQAYPTPVEEGAPDNEDDKDGTFDEADLEFLLKYLAPTYLTPDNLEKISGYFEDNFSVVLLDILNKKFAERLRSYIVDQEARPLPDTSQRIEEEGLWKVARPPHKHRYLYLPPGQSRLGGSPIQELVEILLPSRQFRTWLRIATNSAVQSHDIITRRFRHGKDYTLATGHDGKARLELNLGLTPSSGWTDEMRNDEDDAPTSEDKNNKHKKEKKKDKKAEDKKKPGADKDGESATVEPGGHEVYVSTDVDEDAAVYKSSADDDTLFFNPPSWNTMTLVLRDGGTLRFVKYISQGAKGDRWDISGTFEVEESDDNDQNEESEEEKGDMSEEQVEEDGEEEFNGFSDFE